jgi:hypothetical protein
MIQLPFSVVVQAGIQQQVGNLLMLAAVAGMAAFGFKHGLFLAVLYGLAGLATLLVSLGLGEGVASLLTAVDVPAAYALPVGVGLMAGGAAVGMRLAIGAAVPEGTLRFSPVIDAVGGVLVGALAGLILGGTLLVVLDVMPIPEAYRIGASQKRNDIGATMLRTLARFVEPDAAARQVLLEGEPPAADGTGGVVCSELFVDANGNGLYDGDGETAERHLDHDDSGGFTSRAPFIDTNQNGVRDIGLLERYRLGAWQKLRVMHHPTITSSALVELPAFLKDGQEVYKATATDLDPGDTIVFALRESGSAAEATTDEAAATGGDAAATGEPAFTIDSASGSVTITGVERFMREGKPVTILVVATDAQGLTDEKSVTIKYRGPKPRE